MKYEEVRALVTKAVEKLAAALAAGQSEDLTRYLAAMGRFHRYSVHNAMLIVLQKPKATHVAGFHTWRKLGRFVCKGERGIFILAPLVRKDAEKPEPDTPEGNRVLLGFRGCTVFDYSQTEGRELPSIGRVEGDPSEYQPRLTPLVTAQTVAPPFSEHLAPARGIPEGGKTTLLPGMTPAETFATLVHEVAHELLHRTNRTATTKRQRETEAEAVAFVVCH